MACHINLESALYLILSSFHDIVFHDIVLCVQSVLSLIYIKDLTVTPYHTHTHICTHTHTRIHIHTHTHTLNCMHIHAHACAHTYTHTCMRTHLHTHTHGHACTHTHTHTHTHKHTILPMVLLHCASVCYTAVVGSISCS